MKNLPQDVHVMLCLDAIDEGAVCVCFLKKEKFSSPTLNRNLLS